MKPKPPRKNSAAATPPLSQVNAMKYFFALVFPPLAVLLCGRPFSALLNIPLTLCYWLPGAIHALALVSDHHKQQRHNALLQTLKTPRA